MLEILVDRCMEVASAVPPSQLTPAIVELRELSAPTVFFPLVQPRNNVIVVGNCHLEQYVGIVNHSLQTKAHSREHGAINPNSMCGSSQVQ